MFSETQSVYFLRFSPIKSKESELKDMNQSDELLDKAQAISRLYHQQP